MRITCDIDGCICDVRENVKKYLHGLNDWKAYFAHTLEMPHIPHMLALMLTLSELYDIYFVTGRPESNREDTNEWMKQRFEGFSYHEPILMRPNSFHGSTLALKLTWFAEIKPDVIIDDDPQVVSEAIRLGFLVLQVHGYRWSGTRDYAPGETIPIVGHD